MGLWKTLVLTRSFLNQDISSPFIVMVRPNLSPVYLSSRRIRFYLLQPAENSFGVVLISLMMENGGFCQIQRLGRVR